MRMIFKKVMIESYKQNLFSINFIWKSFKFFFFFFFFAKNRTHVKVGTPQNFFLTFTYELEKQTLKELLK